MGLNDSIEYFGTLDLIIYCAIYTGDEIRLDISNLRNIREVVYRGMQKRFKSNYTSSMKETKYFVSISMLQHSFLQYSTKCW